MKMMNYSAFSNAPYDLTSLLLQTYYRFQLPFVDSYVAKMLGLRLCNVVAWDVMIFGIWGIWARAKGVAMFGVWGT
jgi:hypothetical protein